MVSRLVPAHLKKALDLLEADPARAWTGGEIASACGTGRRTLQRQFRDFVGQMPMEFLRRLRLERARQQLLRASGCASVTETAIRCGFNHVGRFAAQYRKRYGESPSATLSRNRTILLGSAGPLPPLTMAIERPAIAVLGLDLIGPDAARARGLVEGIAAALMRLRWLAVTIPAKARYHLRGTVRDDGAGRLRVMVILLDAPTGRYLWADRWDGSCSDLFEFEERVAARIATAIQPSVREAEIDRAWRRAPTQLNAWELTMRALPRVLSVEAAAEEMALELLEQAMEGAPSDPLPTALAAWCHGLRGSHNFCPRPDQEKAAARELAKRAALLSTGDPLTDTLLAGGYCLAHDLANAAIHAERALALDGGSAWAWGRTGWIKAYEGEPADAIERFQIARALAPSDPLNFLCSVGLAAGHFWAARYDESIRWFERALVENPAAVWINHHLAPAYALAGRKENARRSLAELASAFPGLTIAQVRSGLPFRPGFLDRVAEGLESVGMRPY
jgi:AraC-like DNA-binding protein/tetratricopeptide (TPR) repeat protein